MEKITEKYYLGSNSKNLILYERKVSESGNETYKKIGYYMTIEAVYNALLEKEIKDDCALIKNIEKIVDLIKELKEFTAKFVMENISKK